MPPSIPRKRLRHTPEPPSESKASAKGGSRTAPPRKSTLFDDFDASSTPGSSERNRSSKQSLADLAQDNDDSSSLTSLSDADFEDAPPFKRPKVGGTAIGLGGDEGEDEEGEGEGEGEGEDEDIEFEDVLGLHDSIHSPDAPLPTRDLQLTLIKDTRVSLTSLFGKKGPSKLERKIRIAVHCMHVQFLLWHNAIRNAWLCDPTVQGIVLSHLPPRLWDEVDRWRRSSGLEIPQDSGKKTKGKQKTLNRKQAARRKPPTRQSRDWSEADEHLEKGAVDMSHGDPLFRLAKALSTWWKQRFRITAPGTRKIGYMSLERLDILTKAFLEEDNDSERFGERIRNLEEFRACAETCRGSRDVGSQLFTALLRALGLEARLVASLQTLGYGWSKLEDAVPEEDSHNHTRTIASAPQDENPPRAAKKIIRKRQGRRARPDTTDGSDDSELIGDDSDDDSVIELSQPQSKRERVFDADLEFPHYWTEVLSPVTSRYLPVDPIVKSIVATNRELVEALEPRGSKADKAKQVMAYVVGFSQDGTAKDVTVRYLKRQILPGHTKGARMPVEKVPVYGRDGRVKRHEQFDWFKSVMRGYVKGGKEHPFTEADYEEDSTDLKPANPEKKETKEGEETLQFYKQSKEFVLERHLKREEALLRGVNPVKMFRHKGKGAEADEEPVYSRKDVVQVKSAETWHKQGRAPIPGEDPLKRVAYRAATTNKRREIAEAEAVTGEKVLQGLYSFDQTDWIIPDPIKDGIIPKNGYGNIDLFVEHMCPEGAVHVPYRGAVKVCKRLGIDYAEAVVDFEFGHRMAVPVIQGVVVAEEYHDQVMEELAKDEAEKARKEDDKRRKASLAMWRKMLMGMRIVERIRQDYGDMRDDIEVFGHNRDGDQETGNVEYRDGDMAGGFLPDDSETEQGKEAHNRAGFFPVVDEDEDDGEDLLEVDHGDAE